LGEEFQNFEGTIMPQTVGVYLPTDTMSHLTQLVSLAMLLRAPHPTLTIITTTVIIIIIVVVIVVVLAAMVVVVH
jgi:hypothetical protein